MEAAAPAAAAVDEDDADAEAVWWWESCSVECLPSAELLFFRVELPSLSFDLDFSPNFDVKRSLSACITGCRQK